LRQFLILKQIVMAYKIDPDLCTACGSCIDECPVEAISEGDVYVIDPDACTDCGACADVCPTEAISPE
jgi:ferredoxin